MVALLAIGTLLMALLGRRDDIITTRSSLSARPWRNLIADGYELTAYDLSEARRDLLASAGARAVSDLAGLAGCEVVLTSLPNDQILSDVTLGAGGLVACLASGAIHISTSTVSMANS